MIDMDYLDETTYEEIIKKLTSYKELIEDYWLDLKEKNTDRISEYWHGADAEAFKHKLITTNDYVEKLMDKIDQTIEYYKKYIKILDEEKKDVENGTENKNS